MLFYELMKNHAGIKLFGNYATLRALHDVCHDVIQQAPLSGGNSETLLGLAYDVRKAYEGARIVEKPSEHSPEYGPTFGVEIIWPVILVQSSLLRFSTAYMPSNKRHQGLLFILESVIESAVKADFGLEAAAVIHHWARLPVQEGLSHKLDSRGGIFCSWTKTQRRKRLSNLIWSFDGMYSSMYSIWSTRNKNMISPDEFDAWEGREWPDPKG